MNEKLVKLISQRLFLGRGTIFTGSAMWTGSGPYVGWAGSDINSFKAIKKTITVQRSHNWLQQA
jgi:hypothetical protein